MNVRAGEITLNGSSIVGLKADKLVRRGVGFVPQTNNVFPSLTIAENLQMGLYQNPKVYAERLEFVTGIFDELASDSHNVPARCQVANVRWLPCRGR